MGNITLYTKFIVAIIMGVYNIVNQLWGISIPGIDETSLTVVVNTVLAVLVYVLPNKRT